jgi:hypothetical protein
MMATTSGSTVVRFLRCLLAFAILLSCRNANDPNGIREFELSFHEDSVQAYDSYCPPGVLYCRSWHPDGRAFAGALTLESTASLDAEGSWAGPIDTAATGAVVISTISASLSQCGGFNLTLTQTGDSLVGTYLEDFDCHGRSGAGTVIGHRRP